MAARRQNPILQSMRPSELLTPTPAGLYCPLADVHVDPVRPVDRALITHGHSDHARAGHGSVLATRETLLIMAARYGEDFCGTRQEAEIGRPIDLGGVTATFRPAGHVLGSAQIAFDAKGLQDRRLGRLQARGGSDLHALRADPMRRLHLGGDLRPAGVPPSAGGRGDQEAAALGRALSRPRPSRRRLFARQGAARHRPDPRRRLRGSDLLARRHGARDAALREPRHRPRRVAPCQGGGSQDPRRPHHPVPAERPRRPLVAQIAGPGRRLCVRLDAGARPRPPERRRAAARHLRPCRLAGPAAHDPRDAMLRVVGHPRPGGRARPLGDGRRPRSPSRCTWSAMATRRPRRHEPVRRASGPPRLRAAAQRQDPPALDLFPRDAGPRPRLCPRGDHRRAVVPQRQARPDPRPDRRAHRSRPLRPVLRLCRRPVGDGGADVAGAAGHEPCAEPDRGRRGLDPFLEERAAGPRRPPSRCARRDRALGLPQADHRLAPDRRLGPARQDRRRGARRPPGRRGRARLARPPAAL